MYYTYVVRRLVDDSLYKGHCENIETRGKQHNSGSTQSISNKVPFELVYSEEFETREQAILREKYFKSAAGRRFLKLKIKQNNS